MSITEDAETLAAADRVRYHLGVVGRPQLRLADADQADTGWKRYARCGQWNPDAPDPDLFYPISGDSPDTYAARAYCADCPVRRYCDDWATTRGEPGVWAGLHRGDDRRLSEPCETDGCLNYRSAGRGACTGCASARRAESERIRHRELSQRRRDAAKAAREVVPA